MTVFKGLGDFLLAETSIAAIVGTRLYAGRLPQKPDLTADNAAIVLSMISEPGTLHLRGPVGVYIARWQLDVWAKSLDVVNRVGRLCKWRLHGFTGEWMDNNSPQGIIRVRVIQKDDEQIMPEAEILGGLYRDSSDYRITYSAEEDMVLI